MFASEVWAFLVKKTNLLWLLLSWLPLSSTCHCYLQVQFGHAGACANQASETAVAKNQALRDAGAYVPKSFDELGDVVKWEMHLTDQFIIKLLVGLVFLLLLWIHGETGPFMMSWWPMVPLFLPRRCLPQQCRWITLGLGWEKSSLLLNRFCLSHGAIKWSSNLV